MDTKGAVALLDRITYPEYNMNVKLNVVRPSIWPCHDESCRCDTNPSVRFDIGCVNTYRPENGIMPLSMQQAIPSFVQTDEDFLDWNLSVLIWFSAHETREWFKVDGKPWRDPHNVYNPDVFNPEFEFKRVKAMRAPNHTPERWLRDTKVTFDETYTR